jgi:hydrogenase maturation protein HypF
MLPDLPTVRNHCRVSAAEGRLLSSAARPIVVLQRRCGSTLTHALAPHQKTIGVMLPYTPLHHLLLEPAAGFPDALVMTSGNRHDEPLITDNEVALETLADIADALLLHDRAIHQRCDDSVVRPVRKGRRTAHVLVRRSRGLAPAPLRLPWTMPALLAVGGELKNTFCFTRGPYAFLSQHVGDLNNSETLVAFERGISEFERLLRLKPVRLVCDLHPDYLSTRYALSRATQESLRVTAIQHHHAHIAACMAENGVQSGELVLGAAFDGTGYGPDGTIWGGEFLLCQYGQFERLAGLSSFPLPGGDVAVRNPWRIALALLNAAGLPIPDDSPAVAGLSSGQLGVVQAQLKTGLNSPLTSSMGRLFDGVAALVLGRQRVTYEGQAASELEAIASPDEPGLYPIELDGAGLDWVPLLRMLVRDLQAGVPPQVVSALFHNGLAEGTAQACLRLARQAGVRKVALSGGVWQNALLLRGTLGRLERAGLDVLIHNQVPANDGGLAFGQAIAAFHTGSQ